jgi:FkbM family methyltransferase
MSTDRPLAAARHWLAEQIRYARMGLGLARDVGADPRSRLRLALLALTSVAGHRTVRIRLAGRTFPVALRCRTDLEVLHEIAIDDEYGAADPVQAETIVDCGAHIGLGTLRLLAGHPGARIIAVEADPRLADRLRANVAGLPVTVVQAAVGAEDGRRTFFRGERASWANSVTRVSADQEEVTVPSVTLDSLLRSAGIKRVDLLKLDIEGAEWELLADGVPAGVGALIAEFHARDGRGPRELLETLGPARTPQVIREDERQLVFFAHPPSM